MFFHLPFVLSLQALRGVFFLQALENSLSVFFLQAFFMYWKAIRKSPCSLLFSRMKNPSSLRLTSQKRLFSPLAIFIIFFWTHWTNPCLFCPSDPWAGGSTPGGFSQEWSPQEDCLPYFAGQIFCVAQDMTDFLVCKWALPVYIKLFILQYAKSFSAGLRSMSESVWILSIALTYGHRILTLLNFMIFTWAHTTTCPKVDGISSLQQINHSAWCHVKTC